MSKVKNKNTIDRVNLTQQEIDILLDMYASACADMSVFGKNKKEPLKKLRYIIKKLK